MKDEALRTQAELDQHLSEMLDEIDEWFDELVELGTGDGPITDPKLAELARSAASTCTVVIGLRDYLEDELENGIRDDD